MVVPNQLDAGDYSNLAINDLFTAVQR